MQRNASDTTPRATTHPMHMQTRATDRRARGALAPQTQHDGLVHGLLLRHASSSSCRMLARRHMHAVHMHVHTHRLKCTGVTTHLRAIMWHTYGAHTRTPAYAQGDAHAPCAQAHGRCAIAYDAYNAPGACTCVHVHWNTS